jgi:hypothetical protein
MKVRCAPGKMLARRPDKANAIVKPLSFFWNCDGELTWINAASRCLNPFLGHGQVKPKFTGFQARSRVVPRKASLVHFDLGQ